MPDLFSAFGKLTKIRLLGREVEVPEGTTILRALQYLHTDEVSYGDFCWNNDCGNCEVLVQRQGGASPKRVRGCQYPVSEGLDIIELSGELRSCLAGKLPGV